MFRDRPAIQIRSEGSSEAREALGSLRYIRDTIARSEKFTAVPGWGGVAMGGVGLSAAVIASTRASAAEWLLVWLAAAGVASLIGMVSMLRKARKVGVPLLAGAGRKFALGLVPAVFAASILTMVMYRSGQADLLPGLWLLMFGVAVVTGGQASIRVISTMGLLYMLLGVVAFVVPSSWGDVLMGLGFGGLNVVFGVIIGRRHGG